MTRETRTVIVESETAAGLHSSIMQAIEAYAELGEEPIRERITGTGGEKGFRCEITFRRKE